MKCSFSLMAAALFTAVLTTTSSFAGMLHVPDVYPTIQSAIDAAVDGDEVVVADGTYTGDGNHDLDFGGKAITVRSEHGPDACVIDCQASVVDPHRAFSFMSGESSSAVLEGFHSSRHDPRSRRARTPHHSGLAGGGRDGRLPHRCSGRVRRL